MSHTTHAHACIGAYLKIQMAAPVDRFLNDKARGNALHVGAGEYDIGVLERAAVGNSLLALNDQSVIDDFDYQERIRKLSGPEWIRMGGIILGGLLAFFTFFDLLNVFRALAFISYTSKAILFAAAFGLICIEAITFEKLQHIRDFLAHWAKFTTILFGRGVLYFVIGSLTFACGGLFYTILGLEAYVLAGACFYFHYEISKEHDENGLKASLEKMREQNGKESVVELLEDDATRKGVTSILTQAIKVDFNLAMPRTSFPDNKPGVNSAIAPIQ